MNRILAGATLLLAAAVALGQSRPAADASSAAPSAEVLTRRGAEYLLKTQAADGSWAGETGCGISSLSLWALVQTPGIGPAHPAVERGLEFVLRFQRDDGGIYSAEGLLKNYETSVALSLLARVPGEKAAHAAERAQKFLIENQWDEGEDISVDNPWYGGAGYGQGKRPDLSNTQIMLEALHDSGLPPDHPTFRKAQAFIARSQMLGESNDQPFARDSRDGGFIYSPANNGESKAGTVEVDGRSELRTYGSMTYAGFKSMLYAGLNRDDPRVVAAIEWIGRHWTLDYNPNMPERQSHEGLFYYYHVFGRALQAWGEDEVRDRVGRTHRWRTELTEKLASIQAADGSWANPADRWMEGHPALTTAYAMLALQATQPPSRTAPPAEKPAGR